MDGETRWMTYAEAARVLGVAPESIRRRAMRSSWRRQQGNDGRALVAVPLDALPDSTGDATRGRGGETGGGDVGGGEEVGKLREALAHQTATTEGLRELVGRLERDSQAHRADAATAREEAREARDKLATAEVARAIAEGRTKALEEAAERRRSSWMGRLLGW